jgi:hypothetical protein
MQIMSSATEKLQRRRCLLNESRRVADRSKNQLYLASLRVQVRDSLFCIAQRIWGLGYGLYNWGSIPDTHPDHLRGTSSLLSNCYQRLVVKLTTHLQTVLRLTICEFIPPRALMSLWGDSKLITESTSPSPSLCCNHGAYTSHQHNEMSQEN